VYVEYDTSISSCDFWNDDRAKTIVLTLFQLATRWNSQKPMKLRFIITPGLWIFIWILFFPIGIIEVSTQQKWIFWLYFNSFHDYWPPSTWNPLVHTSRGEMERCDQRAFQLLKMRKKKISWNKNQVRNGYFIDS